MINAGRQISWLGTNLSNCIIKAQKAPGRRGINTSKVLSQQSHTDTKDEKSDIHDESIDTSSCAGGEDEVAETEFCFDYIST